MNLSLVSKWLRKTPQPKFVRVDGDKIVEVGSRLGRWTEVTRTLETLKASKLEALDERKNVLRAIVVDDDEEDDDDKKSALPKGATQNDLLQHFASLIANAYDQGANAQRVAYGSIFEENTKLVRLMADRMSALEVAWMQVLRGNAKLVMDMAAVQAEAAAAGDDDSMMAALTSGLLQGQAEKEAAAGSNGANPPKSKGK